METRHKKALPDGSPLSISTFVNTSKLEVLTKIEMERDMVKCKKYISSI